jgi:hypothetical protein
MKIVHIKLPVVNFNTDAMKITKAPGKWMLNKNDKRSRRSKNSMKIFQHIELMNP